MKRLKADEGYVLYLASDKCLAREVMIRDDEMESLWVQIPKAEADALKEKWANESPSQEIEANFVEE